MREILSEINMDNLTIKPVLNIFKKKKKKAKMLEEQIRDTLPYNGELAPDVVESKEEEDEKF